jgi:hypothetical protein
MSNPGALPSEKTDSEIIDLLGGTTVVAGLFDLKPPSVSEWREKGIPQARKQTLALLYPDKTPPDWRPKVPDKAGGE